jgi:outer membrane protein assembly factor BamE (lipoprotein component of BamABCDE complex)
MYEILSIHRGIIGLAVFMFLTACSTFSRAREENLSQVHPGLSKQELIEIMGEPEKQEIDGPQERWQYVVMSSDHRHDDPYTATFEKGILTNWYFNSPHHEVNSDAQSKNSGGKHHHNE